MKLDYDRDIVRRHARKRATQIKIDRLIITSQLQRSGGSLLIQLLDGKPGLLVHPSELHIGRPNKYFWPNLDTTRGSEKLFIDLSEHPMISKAFHGYSKDGTTKNEKIPFIYLPELHQALFCYLVDNKMQKIGAMPNQNWIIDAFLRSTFASWLDYRGFIGDHHYQFVTHVARLIMHRKQMEKLFCDFPSCHLIMIVRDPASWYVSAAKYSPTEYGDIKKALKLYETCLSEGLHHLKEGGSKRITFVSFEDLIANTKETMNLIEYKLRFPLTKNPIPTFNKIKIASNSSFKPVTGSVDRSPLKRSKKINPKYLNLIESELSEIYKKAKKRCIK